MKNTIKSLSSHIKKGDTVKVIAGKDKGKIGEIIRILKNENRVVVKELILKENTLNLEKKGMLVKYHNLKHRFIALTLCCITKNKK